MTTFTHQDPKDKEVTKEDDNSDDDFSSGSDNDKAAKQTTNAAAKAKTAKAKKSPNAATKTKAAKAKAKVAKADSKKPKPHAKDALRVFVEARSTAVLPTAIRPSTSVKQGGVPVEDPSNSIQETASRSKRDLKIV